MQAFLMYVDDWLSSKCIESMDAAEERGYLRLLMRAAKEPDCGLPDDDAQLAIISLLNRQWNKITSDKSRRIGGRTSGQKLRECFVVRSGRLYNLRLLREFENQKRFHEQRVKAGRSSANGRKFNSHKTIENQQASEVETGNDRSNDRSNERTNGKATSVPTRRATEGQRDPQREGNEPPNETATGEPTNGQREGQRNGSNARRALGFNSSNTEETREQKDSFLRAEELNTPVVCVRRKWTFDEHYQQFVVIARSFWLDIIDEDIDEWYFFGWGKLDSSQKQLAIELLKKRIASGQDFHYCSKKKYFATGEWKREMVPVQPPRNGNAIAEISYVPGHEIRVERPKD